MRPPRAGSWSDDQALVDAARAGDRRAMEVLLDRHYDRVATIAMRMLGNRADAEDATQVALLAVVRGLRSFDGRSATSTWIHRVTVNACLDELRRRRRRPPPVDTAEDTDAHPAAALAEAERADVRLDVEWALAQLPEEFRMAVVLRDVADLDYDAIALLLDLPPGTVRSRIARGRSRLRELLGNPPGGRDVQEVER